MTITIIQLPGEPVLHCLLTGTITAADIEAMLDACAARIADQPGPIFRIIEAQNATTSFNDVVLILDTLTRRGRSTEARSAPPISDVLVGRSEIVALIDDSVQQTQYGRQHIPLFADLDEALAYIRARIEALHAV
jgi:hypothetical protein